MFKSSDSASQSATVTQLIHLPHQDTFSVKTEEGVHVAQDLGKKSEQQDAVRCGVVSDGFCHLDHDVQIASVEAALSDLTQDKDLRKFTSVSGTTACLVLTWLDPKSRVLNIIVGNLGDSRAYLSLPHVAEPLMLNQLHSLKNEHERLKKNRYDKYIIPHNAKLYLEASAGLFGGDRAINMARSLGDRDMITSGLSSKPDVYHYQYVLRREYINDPIHLVVASDGVDGLARTNIQNIINDNLASRNNVAKEIVDHAKEKSRDNQTVVYTRPNTKVQFIVVCDGHGDKGRTVSNIVADKITRRFDKRFITSPDLPFKVMRKPQMRGGQSEYQREVMPELKLTEMIDSKHQFASVISAVKENLYKKYKLSWQCFTEASVRKYDFENKTCCGDECYGPEKSSEFKQNVLAALNNKSFINDLHNAAVLAGRKIKALKHHCAKKSLKTTRLGFFKTDHAGAKCDFKNSLDEINQLSIDQIMSFYHDRSYDFGINETIACYKQALEAGNSKRHKDDLEQIMSHSPFVKTVAGSKSRVC